MRTGAAPKRPYDSLTGRGQLGRLRRLGRAALARSPGGFDGARLGLLRHEHNATFLVEGDGTRHVLRINRPDLQSVATISSEMAWLAALRSDTDLLVPVPEVATDGTLVVIAGQRTARCTSYSILSPSRRAVKTTVKEKGGEGRGESRPDDAV